MQTQTITREKLGELYNLKDVCTNYKQKIEGYLKKDLFATKIEIPQDDIDQAFSDASTTQKKILFKHFKKSETAVDTIKDWKGVLKALKITEVSLGLIKNPKTKEDKCRNAMTKIMCIAKVYNNGWVPNWKNDNEYKYFPYLYFSEGSWLVHCHSYHSHLYCPSGLHFKTNELAMDAIEKFRSIYDDYFMI